MTRKHPWTLWKNARNIAGRAGIPHFLPRFGLDIRATERTMGAMTGKRNAKSDATVGENDATSGQADAARGGRPPSARAVGYLWYRDIDDFETAGRGSGMPWWDDAEYFDWEKEAAIKKSERSGSRGEFKESLKLPGFFWETLRRMPEAQRLVEGMRALHGDGEAGNPGLEVVLARDQALMQFRQRFGPEVDEALMVLRKQWRKSFDHLDDECGARWRARYLALWHHVGKPGSVPATPASFPDPDARSVFSGEQWRTAFDLLAEHAAGEDAVAGYALQPVPGMLLPKFAKLKPPGPALAEQMDPLAGVLPGKTRPESYPWVSMGILSRRLARNHMQPLLLAIDLSRTTDTLLRDIKEMIDRKRESLKICVTDRRVRMNSFDAIRNLDLQVKEQSGRPPMSDVVNSFERAAQLDLSVLVATVGEFVAMMGPDHEEAERIRGNLQLLTHITRLETGKPAKTKRAGRKRKSP